MILKVWPAFLRRSTKHSQHPLPTGLEGSGHPVKAGRQTHLPQRMHTLSWASSFHALAHTWVSVVDCGPG